MIIILYKTKNPNRYQQPYCLALDKTNNLWSKARNTPGLQTGREEQSDRRMEKRTDQQPNFLEMSDSNVNISKETKIQLEIKRVPGMSM